MLKMIVLFCFLPFAFLEVFIYRQFGLVVLGSLYIALSMQAEHAANIVLKHGLRWPVPAREIGPKLRMVSDEEPTPKIENAAPLPKAKAAPRPARRADPPVKEPPKVPNYFGRAHEVLAVPENAATRTIKFAFRFWIKKNHPDHNQFAPSQLANRRAQKITEAKDLLLNRRRAGKSWPT